MSRIINTPEGTKEAHKSYINWLNGLLNNYISSFYDDAVQNIIKLSFIRDYRSFIQELYDNNGLILTNFLSVMPTDTTNFLLMIHNVSDGQPILYNKEDVASLFEFDSSGALIKFYENTTINLFNPEGTIEAYCYITFEDWFGIKCPMLYIKEAGTDTFIGKGMVDIIYSNKYSGCYMVENTPLDDYPHFRIFNVTKLNITMDVPLLTGLNIRYEIAANTFVDIPITKWSSYFFRQGEEFDGVIIKRV